VVLEVAPDRQLGPRLDPECPQIIARAEAGQRQRLWRAIGAGADDHLTLDPHDLEVLFRSTSTSTARPPSKRIRVARTSVSTSTLPRSTAGWG
jgi:hypothetical protein